jgi:hypothetical protein
MLRKRRTKRRSKKIKLTKKKENKQQRHLCHYAALNHQRLSAYRSQIMLICVFLTKNVFDGWHLTRGRKKTKGTLR